MRILTFRASTIQEALQLVRENLGPDASVVNTRRVRRGLFAKTMIEVEASRDLRVPSRFSAETTLGDHQDKSGSAVGRLAEPNIHRLDDRNSTPNSDSIGNSTHENLNHGSDLPGINQNDSSLLMKSGEPIPEPSADLSPMFSEICNEMVEAGVTWKLVAELVQDASSRCDHAFQDDGWLIRGQIVETVAQRLSVAYHVLPSVNEQRSLAFVGPAGAGKTTLLCKMACQAHFDHQLEIGMVTVDSWRSDSADQLLSVADKISASVEAVSSASQLTKALQRLRECDLVMIDTCGRAPDDNKEMNSLRELLQIAQPDEAHLVMEANAEPALIQLSLDRFLQLGATQLNITKLDESAGIGRWLSYLLSCPSPVPIHSLSYGTGEADHFIQPSLRHLASILVGQKVFKASVSKV